MRESSRRQAKREIARAKRVVLVRRGGLAAVATALVFATAPVASNALFVATASTSFGTTTGAVAIGVTPTPVVTTLTTTNLAPGESVVGPIRVSNIGTLAHRYAMTSAVTSPGGSGDALTMAGNLKMEIKTGVTSCDLGGYNGTGQYLYGTGANATVSATNVIGTTSPAPAAKILGDTTQGQQGGDRVLASGASEELCVRVTLPLDTNNDTQGRTSNALLTFNAEQTQNNP